MQSELAQEMLKTRETVLKENMEGGNLKDLPCPFCGLPRSLRSDYVRCQPCGKNWWIGTDLNNNPHAHTKNSILKEVSGTVVHYLHMDPKSGISVEKSCNAQ